MHTSSSRTDIPICTKLGMLIPWDQEENTGRSKLRKSVLSSSPVEGNSCSSETKHNRKTAPRPKLFASKSRLQKQRPQPRQTFLGSSPGEDGFCSWVTTHDRRTTSRPKLFVLAERLQQKRPQPRKMSWVLTSVKVVTEAKVTNPKSVLGSSPGEDAGFRNNNFFLWYSTMRIEWSGLWWAFEAIQIDMKCKHLSNFAAVTLRALR
jgi:hypothetical protein